MNALRKVEPVMRAEEVEVSLVVPLMHDAEAIEHRNVVRLSHRADIVQIGRHRNHRLGARTILRIDQDHVGSRLSQRNHAFVDGNKRIAFMSLMTFLRKNEVRFAPEQAHATAIILSLAAGEVSEESLTRWIRDNWPKP